MQKIFGGVTIYNFSFLAITKTRENKAIRAQPFQLLKKKLNFYIQKVGEMFFAPVFLTFLNFQSFLIPGMVVPGISTLS